MLQNTLDYSQAQKIRGKPYCFSRVWSVEISDISKTDYNYDLSVTENERVFKLFFKFNVKTTKTPLLKVFFNLPLYIINHNESRLTTRNLSLQMRSYFAMNDINPEQKQSIEKTSSSTRKSTNWLMWLRSFLTAGSSANQRFSLLMEKLKLLRWI